MLDRNNDPLVLEDSTANNNDNNNHNMSGGVPRRRTPWIRKPVWALDQAEQDMNAGVRGAAGTETVSSDEISVPLLGEEEDRDPSSAASPQANRRMKPHLSLFDLVTLGVGITIGSGIFVLSAVIAHKYAGPATVLSWSLSGIAAFLSALCYAEISGHIPSSGSSYAYAFASMGELPAFITAACLTLEYLVTGAAVGRSWGDKFLSWISIELGAGDGLRKYLDPGFEFKPMAIIIVVICTGIVCAGVKESKVVTTFMTWSKVALVTFMSITGLALFKPSNMVPFVPSQFGANGIFLGATKSFFGYMGYDAICCVAGEAVNPRQNVPKAIMITVSIVSVLYITATLALTGMQSYKDIDPVGGFATAFRSNGLEWAAQITSAGEVALLPLVVLASIMIQPRVQYAVSYDGLLPPIFRELNKKNNPVKGILIAGTVMSLLSGFLSFSSLNDFVSCGYLFSFSTTNSALLLMTYESPAYSPKLLQFLIALFHPLALGTAMVFSHVHDDVLRLTFGFILGAAMVAVTITIYIKCPRGTIFGGRTMGIEDDGTETYFSAPFLPFLPCLSSFLNWTLVAQLSLNGIALFFAYLLAAVIFYFAYGIKHSVANTYGYTRHTDAETLTGERSKTAAAY